MTRKTVLKRFLPVLLILVVIVCAVIIFSKCSTKQTVPYGSVSNDEYFSYKVNGETRTISERELYDRLRYNSYEVVVDYVEKAMFKDYIEQVKAEAADKTSETYKDLIKQIDSDCFGTTSKKEIDKLETEEPKKFQAKIMQFYDSLQKSGYNFINADGSYNFDIDNLYTEKIFETYYLSMAKRAYAKEKLLVAINDEESDYYIDDINENREDTYDSDYSTKDDIQALIVKFDSRADAQNALKELNLKYIKGLLYYVPRGTMNYTEYETFYSNAKQGSTNGGETVVEISSDIEILLEYVRIYNATYQYKKQISLKGVTLDVETTYSQLKALADQYVTAANEDESIAKENLINDILTFDEAYDKDNDGNIVEDADGNKVTNDKLNKNVFSYTYDELYSFDSSICSYVYDSLVAGTYFDDAKKVSNDYYEDKTQSTPKEQSASDGYFLAYKFLDSNPFTYNEIKRLSEDENDENGKWTKKFNEIKDDTYEDVIDGLLTQTYIDEVVNELYENIYEEKELLIYDPLIQVFYKYNNSDYSKTNKKSSDQVLSLKTSYTTTKDGNEVTHNVDYTLSVDELYSKLESVYGTSTSYDMAVGEILKSQYEGELTSDDISDLEDELENLLASFSQGGMESNGYPASIGKQAFLQIYLNVESSKEAIELVYKRSKYEELFEEDLEAQAKLFSYSGYDSSTFGELDNTTDDLYKAFAQLSKTFYDNYYSLKYKNILISTDFNNDGSPDDPDDYKDDTTLYTYEGEDYTLYEYIRVLSAELFNLIISEVDKASTMEEGLTTVVNEYDQASKYAAAPDDDVSAKYGKFKKAGLEIKVESEATSTNGSSLVQEFLDNMEDFYKYVIKDDFKNTTGWKNLIYASAIKYTDYYDSNSNIERQATKDSLLQTQYGYHALYVTGYSDYTSCKWNYDKDNVTIQGKPVYSEIYANEKDYPTVAQIKTYVEEYSDGYEDLPSQVQNGLTACFADKYSKFTSSDFRNYMMFLLIKKNDGTFKDEEDNAQANIYMQMIKNSINSYENDEETAAYKANELWWSLFN